MNKSRMKKNALSHVQLRPVAKRFYGAEGPQLPPVDDDWLIQSVEDAGVRISNNHTGHGTLLAWDQIHHYATDPDRGGRNGFLITTRRSTSAGIPCGASRPSALAKRSPTRSVTCAAGSAKTTRSIFRTRTQARLCRHHRSRRRREPRAPVLRCSCACA